jgi:hypothetical protein
MTVWIYLLGLLSGVVFGAVLVDLLFVVPAREQAEALQWRLVQRSTRDELDRAEYRAWRTRHAGTPYVARDPEDHQQWLSRKVPLEVVQ